jgi:hypothetical protein
MVMGCCANGSCNGWSYLSQHQPSLSKIVTCIYNGKSGLESAVSFRLF